MADGIVDLSSTQVRKIVLLSQGIHKPSQFGSGVKALHKAIEKLGYIQIDTISVVERAHHHTLWNRVKTYNPDHLATLQEQHKVFEYWSHAAAYLPMRDYRYSLPRKQAIANGSEKHWHFRNAKLNKQVLKRIQEEGPLQSKDFDQKSKGGTNEWWQFKPAKVALEQLFMEGELMITGRQGFQKIYDLTERALPANIDTSMPDQTDFQQHLIVRYLDANGIGTPAEISYLRKGIKASVARQCQQMVEDGQLLALSLNQQQYYALPRVEELLSQSLSRTRVKILSPFDNLLIQRKRMLELFNFDYQIECYVPAAKRRYGYFCLPLLWGQGFAGRLDAKIDRKTGVLSIFKLHLETSKPVEFAAALRPALIEFLHFNRGRELQLHSVTADRIEVTPMLEQEINLQLSI